jgi:hypothetical protein
MTAFPTGAGTAIESAPRGREDCSGSRPAERCLIADAFAVPRTTVITRGHWPLDRGGVRARMCLSQTQ